MSERKYVPGEPPVSPEHLPEYLSRELRRIEASIDLASRRYDIQFASGTADASAAETIICDASASLVVINLPGVSADGSPFYRVVKSNGANNVIVRTTETINGAGSSTLSAQYQVGFFFRDNKEWFQS